ncbi:MAG TPA: FAD-dependent oxidoreductase, partial [Thermomonas sp.]|nr:FAD-dependent oxidoreductase [Thermomonas sp.]
MRERSHRRCRQDPTVSQAFHNFDVIVVGGGHAGTEAALASARAASVPA